MTDLFRVFRKYGNLELRDCQMISSQLFGCLYAKLTRGKEQSSDPNWQRSGGQARTGRLSVASVRCKRVCEQKIATGVRSRVKVKCRR